MVTSSHPRSGNDAESRICLLRGASRGSARSSLYRFDGARRSERDSPLLIFQRTSRGRGAVDFGSPPRETHVVGPGRAFAVVAPSAHCYYYPADAAAPWDFDFVTISLGEQGPLVRSALGEAGRVFDLPESSALAASLYDAISALERHAGALDIYSRSAIAYRILMELLRFLDPATITASTSTPARRAAEVARTRFGENLAVSDLADAAGVSPQTLHRAFMREIGVPPGRYLIRRRIDHARKRLIETDQPLAAIAEECGFRNDNYFCKVFRREVGMTPTRFRHSGPEAAAVYGNEG